MENLDAMSDDELQVATETFEALADYAELKQCAMRHRLAGRTGKALEYEEACYRIYKGLPEWARW